MVRSHDPARFDEVPRRYLAELAASEETLRAIDDLPNLGRVSCSRRRMAEHTTTRSSSRDYLLERSKGPASDTSSSAPRGHSKMDRARRLTRSALRSAFTTHRHRMLQGRASGATVLLIRTAESHDCRRRRRGGSPSSRRGERGAHPVDHGECGFRISLCAHVQPSMQDQWLRDEQTTP